ncbi:MAG: hypothetical protein EA382_05605 [Spirochaetaceae bacterium]|nr:MAG: hypothetical protein EA382_05605 [Spirochaetaceae bacterium]
MNESKDALTPDETIEVKIGFVSRTYARMIGWLVTISLSTLVAAFVLYVSGLLPSSLPVETIPGLWHLSAADCAAATNRTIGWQWITQVADGRYLVYLSLVLFPAGTMLLVAIASPLYLRARAPLMSLIALLEAAVLLFAAIAV